MKRFINPTRAAIAALLLSAAGILTACTDSTDLPTDGATTPQAGITSLLPAKPGYTPLPANTRVSAENGSWETGDKVTATIKFYSDSEGRQYIPNSEVTQTLTYTATGSWTADPAVVDINSGARSMSVGYAYTGNPDVLTNTREWITGNATSASGTAVGGNDILATQAGIIPISDVTGTLSLKTEFYRASGLVSVTLHPGQTVEMLRNGNAFADATNTGTAPVTANFHVADPTFSNNTFTLRLKDNPEETTCKNVPIQNGWKFTIDASQLNGGAGGGDQQMVTATGLKMEELTSDKFNGQNNVWLITGGGNDADDKLVTGNVSAAIRALKDQGVTNIDLIMSAVQKLPENWLMSATGDFSQKPMLRSVSLPAATSIGANAFFNCVSLTAVVAPEATSIGEAAFSDCTALTAFDAPLATTIGKAAFNSCKNLQSISLVAADAINDETFNRCSSLTTIDVSQAKEIGNSAFLGCAALTTIDASQATRIGAQAFSSCAKLTTIDAPLAMNIGFQAFVGCAALETLSLPAAMNIGGQAFQNCAALTRLELTAEGNITLHANTFVGFDVAANCTLVLNKDKQKDVTGDGKTWRDQTWKAILYNGTTLPGVGNGGSGLPK